MRILLNICITTRSNHCFPTFLPVLIDKWVNTLKKGPKSSHFRIGNLCCFNSSLVKHGQMKARRSCTALQTQGWDRPGWFPLGEISNVPQLPCWKLRLTEYLRWWQSYRPHVLVLPCRAGFVSRSLPRLFTSSSLPFQFTCKWHLP